MINEKDFPNWYGYSIIDNFLTSEDFNNAKTILRSIEKPDLKNTHLVPMVFEWTGSEPDCIDLYEGDIFDETSISNAKKLVINQFPFLLENLERFAPDRIDKVKYISLNWQWVGKDFVYHIHPDIPIKLLSTIIYLIPESNTGTIIHKSKRINSKSQEIEWKQNRAFMFAARHDTWHSYKGDGISPRGTLCMNLQSETLSNYK